MAIPASALKKLKRIKRDYATKVELPEPDEWRDWSQDDIWHTLVVQVIVVGRAEPGERLWSRPDLLRRLSFRRLEGLSGGRVRAEINAVLREVGTRYASADPAKCRKTKALCHNFGVLARTKGGPKGFVRRYLAPIEGRNAGLRRVKYVMKVLRYLKSKSARDFLMTLGMVTDAIAIDVRVQNILKKSGIKVPKDVLSDHQVYDRFEKRLLEEVCVPLGMSGVHFDRMLFQNYDAILEALD